MQKNKMIVLGRLEMKESVGLEEMEEFDPAYPHVLLLVCRWYGKESEVANIMVNL